MGQSYAPEDLVKLVQAQIAPLKDVGFVYEGKVQWIGPKSLLGTDLEGFGREFQGTYLYRNDRSALLDVFNKDLHAGSEILRSKQSLLGGRMESVRNALDERTTPDKSRGVKIGTGSMESFTSEISPHLFFWTWWLSLLHDLQKWGYEFQGWEDVDGRSCLRFQLNRVFGPERSQLEFKRYWIDMERNATILKVEFFQKGKFSSRIDQVKVMRVATGGNESFWLAVGARSQGFVWNGQSYSEPVQETLMYVVNGSILVNSGLPDAIFTVSRNAGLPTSGELQKLRMAASNLPLAKEFEANPPLSRPKTDPASVRESIETRLAEADKQAEQLQASSPSRRVGHRF